MKALSGIERKTVRNGALGIANVVAGFVIVFTGMDSSWDWVLLVWCAANVVISAYYVQSDLKESLRREEDA